MLSIQSGINEPRYVSIMGIRKASKVERKVFKAAAYQEDVTRHDRAREMGLPAKKGGAAMLTGEMESVCTGAAGNPEGKGGVSMSYALVVAEVRRGLFEERNLDTLGLANLLGQEIVLLVPDGTSPVDEMARDDDHQGKVDEADFLNPLTMAAIVRKVIEAKGKPDAILFTGSSSGIELAAYLAGGLDLPIITDVSGFDAERGVFSRAITPTRYSASSSRGKAPSSPP